MSNIHLPGLSALQAGAPRGLMGRQSGFVPHVGTGGGGGGGLAGILIGLLLPAHQGGAGVELTDGLLLPASGGGAIPLHVVVAGLAPGDRRLIGKTRCTIQYPGGAAVVELSFAPKGRRVGSIGELLPAVRGGLLQIDGAAWPAPSGDVAWISGMGGVRAGDGSVRPFGPTTFMAQVEQQHMFMPLPAVQKVRVAARRCESHQTPLGTLIALAFGNGGLAPQFFALTAG